MASRPPCGNHTVLSSNQATRITRCGCGIVHLTLIGSGVTVRLTAETMRQVSAGMVSALDHVDECAPIDSTTTVN